MYRMTYLFATNVRFLWNLSSFAHDDHQILITIIGADLILKDVLPVVITLSRDLVPNIRLA